MKPLLSILISIFTLTTALSKEIKVNVVFENLTEHSTISGVFYISETQERIPINSLEKFTITLPSKGKYQFKFYSEEVNAHTYYPVRMTHQKNTVTIRLKDKTTSQEHAISSINSPIKDISSFSMEQIEEEIQNESINFIVHSLITISPEQIEAFKKMFGLGFRIENCVVDPISFKTAMSTNKKLELYLNMKFGEVWKAHLPAQPFGLTSL